MSKNPVIEENKNKEATKNPKTLIQNDRTEKTRATTKALTPDFIFWVLRPRYINFLILSDCTLLLFRSYSK